MARRNLVHPDQPVTLRWLLTVFQAAASLKLAVTLIFTCAGTLAWATFVESEYGTPAVQFGVYGSTWFTLINLLLAINIFSAAAIRYPWKRYQTGFVITHIGLLTLLFGCLLTRRGWIDAQMPVFEDGVASRAFTDERHVQLTVHRPGQGADTIEAPLAAGPFNWQDYDTLFQPLTVKFLDDRGWADRWAGRASIAIKNLFRLTSEWAFRLARRDQGVLFDSDGIRLEILDYYADAIPVSAPYLKLMLSAPSRPEMGSDGKSRPGKVSWMPISLNVRPSSKIDFPSGMGDQRNVGGGQITFALAGSETQRDAFLANVPQDDLGKTGQIALFAKGESFSIQVDELLDDDLTPKKDGKARFRLGTTGLEMELVQFQRHGAYDQDPAGESLILVGSTHDGSDPGPAIELYLVREGKRIGRMVLFADHPHLGIQDYQNQIFGSYWFDHGEKSAEELMRGQGGSRIDILQGPHQNLFYRYWNRKKVVAVGALPRDGTRIDAFTMPIAQLQMYVDDFLGRTEPGKVERPVPFNRAKSANERRPAARMRLTVGEKIEEFWIAAVPGEPYERQLLENERHTAADGGRVVTVTMRPHDAIREASFQVRLKKFERKLDPGTSQASHYGSIVDILDRPDDFHDEPKVLRKDVEIEMNAPVDIVDPTSGRTYRLFQESFQNWQPDEPIYKQFADKSSGREQFYMSILTVNYDPGRGTKYAGCLLIITGVFTMFYMRAYFFKPKSKPPTRREKKETPSLEPVA